MAQDEHLKLAALSPHPLAFLRYDALAVVYFVAAVFLQTIFGIMRQSGFDIAVGLVGYGELAIFWLVLILPALAVGVLWVSKQPLVYSVLVGVAGTILIVYLGLTPAAVLPGLLAGSAVLAVIFVEFYRRGHKYFVTDRRLVLSKGYLSNSTREMYYSRLTEVVINQGVAGKIFNFGTIIPVSQSGMGLGEDTAGAFGAVGVSRGRVAVGGGVFGAKGVAVPRAATYYSLYGVPAPRKIAEVISELIRASEEVPYLKEIRDMMARAEGGTPKPVQSPANPGQSNQEKEQEA